MNRDQRVATGLGLLAVAYLIGAWRLPRFALGVAVVEAHVFPLALGLLLLGLSGLYFFQSARASRAAKPLLEGVNKPLLIKLVATTFVYGLILGPVGYVIATAAFLIATMYLLGRRPWTAIIAWGLGFSSLTYAVFVHVLKVPLAQGILPF